jgi:hypothetical protein
LVIQMPGFKESVGRAIHLGTGERPLLDMRLEIGGRPLLSL